MKTIQQILGSRNLIGLINAVNGGVPTKFLPPAFFTTTKRTNGDYGTYRITNNTRQMARSAAYGAKARATDVAGVGEMPVKLLHFVESIVHKPTTMMSLMNMADENVQRAGIETVAYQTTEFGRRFLNARAGSVYSVLAKGTINFDADGNYVMTPAAGGVDVDLKVPAGNQGNIGGIIDANWNVATTKIVQQIANVKQLAEQTSGRTLTQAFYSKNILQNILRNDDAKALLQSNSMLSNALSTMTIPNGFMGLTWSPVAGSFFENANGTQTNFFDDDALVLTPDVSSDWWEMLEGTYPVPRNIGQVANDAESILASLDIVQGMFQYATVTTNPPQIEQVAGDTFLPTLKVPSAIFQIDTKPA